jgi:acetyl esterase
MNHPYVDPDTARLLQSFRAMSGVKLRELPLAEARAAAAGMSQQLDLPCPETCAVTPLVMEGATPIPARLYLPGGDERHSAAAAGPVILYAHGGGWVLGDLEYADALCRHLATRTHRRVVSVDYRLAPEHPFPAAFEDVTAAMSWIASSPPVLGAKVSAIALAGDSAGGGLVAAAALHREQTPSAPVVALLMFYPVTDISRTTSSYEQFAADFVLEAEDMHYFAAAYAPAAEVRRDSRVSPLRAESLAALPPTTLLTCGLDILRDEGRAFAAHLARDGVDITYIEVRGHTHGMATMRGALPSARDPINRAIDAFRVHIDQATQD